MKLQHHTEQSLSICTHLAKSGLPLSLQQRIGAFHIVWSLFESNLETALWKLSEEDVRGSFPSTDSVPISKWIQKLKLGSPRFSTEANGILHLSAQTAIDLMEYRHALSHGYLCPIAGGTAVFIRNPKWHGESRHRPTNDAHVDNNLLDMAITAAWTLYKTSVAISATCSDSKKLPVLMALKSELRSACGLANELRHLTSLMNHEKY